MVAGVVKESVKLQMLVVIGVGVEVGVAVGFWEVMVLLQELGAVWVQVEVVQV
jgi:hypothetical protein